MNLSIPLPIQVVIDDVGWWSGKDSSADNGPFRTGFVRNHVPADYQAIVDLGKALNIRPQAAMILGEWDRTNAIAQLPSASKYGTAWDNSRWVGPWLEEASDIISSNPDYFELTLHGIGHEYWDGETFTRGEWYDEYGQLRPFETVRQRLELYAALLEENNLGPFPESHVPCAFRHIFAPDGDSIIPHFKEAGIKYISTPYSCMLNKDKPQQKYFGVDQNIMTIDRGHDLYQWTVFNPQPEGTIKGPICGMHWPALLHEDPQQNTEVIERWAEFLKPYDQAFETMLARNTKELATQLAYHECTKVKTKKHEVRFDIHGLHKLEIAHLDSRFTIKVEAPPESSFYGDKLEIVSSSWEPFGNYHILTFEPLEPVCTLGITAD